MSCRKKLYHYSCAYSCLHVILIDYHPYDSRLTISKRDINDHNIPLIEAATKDKDDPLCPDGRHPM